MPVAAFSFLRLNEKALVSRFNIGHTTKSFIGSVLTSLMSSRGLVYLQVL